MPLSPLRGAPRPKPPRARCVCRNRRNAGLRDSKNAGLAALVEFVLEFRQATPEPLRLDHAMRGQTDLIGCKGLRHVVDRAAPDGVDRALDRGVRGHDDHAELGLSGQNLGQKLETRICAEPQVEKHDVEVPAIESLERGAARRDAQHARAGGLQAQPQRLTYTGVIVDDQCGPRRLGVVSNPPRPWWTACSMARSLPHSHRFRYRRAARKSRHHPQGLSSVRRLIIRNVRDCGTTPDWPAPRSDSRAAPPSRSPVRCPGPA